MPVPPVGGRVGPEVAGGAGKDDKDTRDTKDPKDPESRP